MSINTIFLDRDGVINEESNYLHKVDDFKFINGVFEACKHFLNQDYQIIIITNQSGISRGYFSEKDYQVLTNWMLEQFNNHGIEILDIFYCPHSASANCKCRKPKPGMFIQAQKKHEINMKNSWMIGDSERDINAAKSAGINNTILVRSGHKVNEPLSKAKFIFNSIIDSKKVI
jgi:D-glycero-D-manno-heptose 1,7-bisphosphate phosphatase